MDNAIGAGNCRPDIRQLDISNGSLFYSSYTAFKYYVNTCIRDVPAQGPIPSLCRCFTLNNLMLIRLAIKIN